MGRYEPEPEGSYYVVRDRLTGELVQHQTLLVPERYRSERRARRRVAALEEALVADDAPGAPEEREGE